MYKAGQQSQILVLVTLAKVGKSNLVWTYFLLLTLRKLRQMKMENYLP